MFKGNVKTGNIFISDVGHNQKLLALVRVIQIDQLTFKSLVTANANNLLVRGSSCKKTNSGTSYILIIKFTMYMKSL